MACCPPKIDPKLVISPADLDKKITIERQTATDETDGDTQLAWTPFATVYAEMTPLSTRWLMVDGQPALAGLIKVRMRYLPGLLASDQVDYQGRKMSIKEVLNIKERNMVHELTVQEAQTNG